MLLGVIFILTAASALGICFAAGAFETLMWLWLLPVSLAVGFLLFLAAAFGFLVLVCAFVDPDKPREKDSRFFRTLAKWYIAAIIPLAGLKVHTRGLEKTPKQGRFLLVCNHLHEIDPAILLHYFSKSQLAFISKQENHDMFLVGKVMPMLLCPLINRENDREALKTILRCISLLKEDKVSVGVFPEGYIHKEKRKLQHFRPGVFKIAQKANVPIVVCTLRDTHKVLGRLLKGKRSEIHLHLLDVIPAEHVKALSTVELAQEVYEMMAKDLGPENVLTEEEENT
jgi:1-acyl-sn-glycerol-3-phosphate acyltransferase